jgi:hypothetical protein
MRIDGFDPVHQVAVSVVSSTSGREDRGTEAAGHWSLLARIGRRRLWSGAGREKGEIKDGAPFQRQVLDLVGVDHLADRTGFGGHQGSRPGNLDGLRHGADL